VATVLIIDSEDDLVLVEVLRDLTDGLFIRRASGDPLPAYAQILYRHADLFSCERLYLIDDSLAGPSDPDAFAWLIRACRETGADILGLSESDEPDWHLHPYFLAIGARALGAPWFQKFFRDLAQRPHQKRLQDDAAMRLIRVAQRCGLGCSSLFGRRAFGAAEKGAPTAVADIFGGLPTTPPRTIDRPATVPASPARPPRIAFVAPWNFNNGQAVAARGYIGALRRIGVDINLHPVARPFHIHQRIAPPVAISDFTGPADLTIVQVNPDAWNDVLTEDQRQIIAGSGRRAGLWVWEMAEIPESWFPAFNQVDTIWAPSRYCADVFAARSRVPVAVVPHVMPIDPSPGNRRAADALRRHLGLGTENRIILYVFDGASYLIRKNPAALLRAFAAAELAGQGWRLILKTKNLYDSAEEGLRLRALAETTEGALLLDRTLERPLLEELIRAADIYASPHCSEGFGLTVAEAMAAGKVAIATDYSGTADFLDETCGFPVRYAITALDGDSPVYRRGGVWAKVDEEHLADCLRRAATLVEAGDRHLGEAAIRRIQDRLSLDAVGTALSRAIGDVLGSGEARRASP
jgi:glycosyltransferase involved in cell wall biosynthesis